LNHGSTSAYTPVLRNPRLFHHNPARSTSTYYPIQQTGARPNINVYPPTAQYTLQSRSMVQAQYRSPQTHPYYPASPRSEVLPPIPFSSYPVPTFSYEPTVSSNGLALILIATLILVALDLVIVRPQKR